MGRPRGPRRESEYMAAQNRRPAVQKSSANDITEGVIWKQLLLFFFPILLGAAFQQLYNTVDAVVVGRFVGTSELAAVGGTSGSIINLVLGFFIGFSSGATVIVSQYFGAGDDRNVSRSVHNAVALALAGGVLFTAAGIALAGQALRWMNTPAEVQGNSEIYLRIYFAGMVPNLFYNIASGILRAGGDSRRPLYILIFTCGVNIVLDLLFVVVFRWGVTGVAAATVASQLVSAVMSAVCLARTTESYRLEFRKIRFHRDLLQSTLKIGMPAGLQSVVCNAANLVIQTNINMLGAKTMAAYTAFTRIDAVFWMMINAFGIAVTTFAGQNYGAGRIDRVKKSMVTTLVMSMAASAGLSVFLHFFGIYLYRLFSADSAVIGIGMEILYFLTPTYVTYVSIEIISGALRAMGFVVVPMILTCGGICVLRLVWLMTAVPGHRTVTTILFSYPLSWTVTSILFIIYYFVLLKKGKIACPVRNGRGS